MEFRIKRAPRIEAEITVPGDKSISHRAVILGGSDQWRLRLARFPPE